MKFLKSSVLVFVACCGAAHAIAPAAVPARPAPAPARPAPAKAAPNKAVPAEPSHPATPYTPPILVRPSNTKECDRDKNKECKQ